MLYYLFLSILSGLLFAISWPANGIPLFIFFAFIPLLLLENSLTKFSKIKRKSLAIFLYSFLTFFIWNILTTWWLYNSLNPNGSHSIVAVAVPNLLNPNMMSLVVLSYHIFKKKVGTYLSFLFLIVLWIGFEKLHSTWELSWPWLTLGNVFSGWHQMVQWYDNTGIFGGTLWVLVVNIFGYYAYRLYQVTRKRKLFLKNTAIFLALIILPTALSLIKYYNIDLTSKNTVNAVLLQPDLDPYNEKYIKDSITIVNELLSIAQKNSKEKVDFYIAPETAIPGNGSLSENGFHNSWVIRDIDNFLISSPKSIFVTGASTYKVYPNEDSKSETAYYLDNFSVWLDSYNSVLQIAPGEEIQTYHKDKLVPGVESFPYINVLKPILGDAMLNMGGTVASLGSDKVRKVFSNPYNKAKIAPIVCYESAFGEYVTGYVKNGANLLAVMTNDSWWGYSPGHRQLLALAKLRAIETRKDVVRAANSGISAHINARGDIVDDLPYGAKGAVKVKANLYNGETPYVRYGDVIYRISLFILGFLTIYFCSQVFFTSRIKR